MKEKNARGFYDTLSADYDSMIGFDKSLAKRTEALKSFILPADRAAADLGCGSGLDSIALARAGLKVSGFDISPGMVAEAKKNARRNNVKISFAVSPISKIDGAYNKKYSFALSLGNSLANINPKGLSQSIRKIYSLLEPEGHILIQILNYNKILSLKKRMVGITEEGNNMFIRFYDFGKDKTYFNILKVEKGSTASHSLITTEIFPYRSGEITKMLKSAGFKRIKKYGGLNKSPYISSESADLVITAFK